MEICDDKKHTSPKSTGKGKIIILLYDFITALISFSKIRGDKLFFNYIYELLRS